MEVESTPLRDVYVLTPSIFQDDRGFFLETYRKDLLHEEIGLDLEFVQDNHSGSVKNVVRGLHFQWEPPMGKLMRVSVGRAFLVAVDIRKGSPTLGQWFGLEASAENRKQLWAPAGCARGFGALSDGVEVQYKCTGAYNSACESGIRWDDPEIAIRWPLADPILSDKDKNAQSLAQWLERPESDFFTY